MSIKILVPTDFSKLSKVAVHYAAKMAMKIDAEIVLFNVVFMDAPPRGGAALKVTSIEKIMVEEAQNDSQNLIDEIQEECKGRLRISYKVIKDFPVNDAVIKFARTHGVDLIVLGTKGATGLVKVLIGSNAASVINDSPLPVLTIPEFARFVSLKHMVVASDMWEVDEEVKKVAPFARLFDATVHFLHVHLHDSKRQVEEKKIKEHLLTVSDYDKITVHVSDAENVIEGIDDYLADKQADMLTMFTHKLTFFEKLFGKSVTQEMAFHTRVPLLSIKK